MKQKKSVGTVLLILVLGALIGSTFGVGGQPPMGTESLALEEANYSVGVPHVQGQEQLGHRFPSFGDGARVPRASSAILLLRDRYGTPHAGNPVAR